MSKIAHAGKYTGTVLVTHIFTTQVQTTAKCYLSYFLSNMRFLSQQGDEFVIDIGL